MAKRSAATIVGYAVRDAMSVSLLESGYGLTPTRWYGNWYGNRGITLWQRSLDWRVEQVQLNIRTGLVPQLSVSVSWCVLLPTGQAVHADGMMTEYLARGAYGHPLPTGAVVPEGFASNVTALVRADLSVGLKWLAGTASLRAAIVRLQSPERNGCGCGSVPHRQVVEYLSGLVTG